MSKLRRRRPAATATGRVRLADVTAGTLATDGADAVSTGDPAAVDGGVLCAAWGVADPDTGEVFFGPLIAAEMAAVGCARTRSRAPGGAGLEGDPGCPADRSARRAPAGPE